MKIPLICIRECISASHVLRVAITAELEGGVIDFERRPTPLVCLFACPLQRGEKFLWFGRKVRRTLHIWILNNDFQIAYGVVRI